MKGELVKERILQKIFNDAPDGATHYCIDDSSYFSFDDESGMWSKWGSNRWYAYLGSISSRLISRPPKQEPEPIDSEFVEWMPEVGQECEIAGQTEFFKHDEPEGHKVKIYTKFTDDRGTELFAYVDKYGKVGGVGLAKLFRPLKTDDDKEREENLTKLARGIMQFAMSRAESGHIFDNGPDVLAKHIHDKLGWRPTKDS